jgi:hypothetical protein
MKTFLAVLVAVCLAVGATYLFFPRRETTYIPHIETVYDTVETLVPRLDTVWRTRTLTKVETLPNVIDTVTIQAAPETVTVVLEAVCPQSLQVGSYGEREDPTVVEGRTYRYDSTRTLLAQPWRVTYFTPGPLDAMVGDTFPPRLTFRPEPRECNFLCRLGLVGLGALGGAAAAGAACIASHAVR